MLTAKVNNSKVVSTALSPRMIVLSVMKPMVRTAGIVRLNARQRGSQREINGALKLVRQRGSDSGQGFGRQYQHRHEQTPERGRRTQNADAVVNRHRDPFGEDNDWDDIRQQQEAVIAHRLN